ncbi:hypothetical protein [Pseudorhodoferax sp. Leaf274]|uniref:hypothetical protein n=1 Tax=Pseudorhodoferax sp. Leaf274 TaxID=1736318 RepID=UPI0012E2006F|nr:hypothetical protein [Pseudorhodoferax sp. Leaf274]
MRIFAAALVPLMKQATRCVTPHAIGAPSSHGVTILLPARSTEKSAAHSPGPNGHKNPPRHFGSRLHHVEPLKIKYIENKYSRRNMTKYRVKR